MRTYKFDPKEVEVQKERLNNVFGCADVAA